MAVVDAAPCSRKSGFRSKSDRRRQSCSTWVAGTPCRSLARQIAESGKDRLPQQAHQSIGGRSCTCCQSLKVRDREAGSRDKHQASSTLRRFSVGFSFRLRVSVLLEYSISAPKRNLSVYTHLPVINDFYQSGTTGGLLVPSLTA